MLSGDRWYLDQVLDLNGFVNCRMIKCDTIIYEYCDGIEVLMMMIMIMCSWIQWGREELSSDGAKIV
jgi:hypothetical protein